MSYVALLAAGMITFTTPVIAQQKSVSHAPREAAFQLLRHEGILHGKTRVDSATWSGGLWIIRLRHPDGRITDWTVDAKAEDYSYVCKD